MGKVPGKNFLLPLLISKIIIAVIFCLWAFIPGRITEGFVVDKRYEPERTTMVMSGKVLVPVVEDEEWLLIIEGHSPARGLRKEGIRRQTKEVSKEAYESYKVGDWVEF